LRLCLDCRGYACADCWNDDAGLCQSCVPLAAVASDDMPEVDERAAIAWPALDLEHDWGLDTPAAEPGPAPWAEAELPVLADYPATTDVIEEPRSEPPASASSAPPLEAVGVVEPGDTSALPAESPSEVVLPARPAANRAGWLSRTFHRRPTTNDEAKSSAPDVGGDAQAELLDADQPAGEVGSDETAQVAATAELDLDALMAAVAAFPIDAIALDSAEAAASEAVPHRPEAQVTAQLAAPEPEPEPAVALAPEPGPEWPTPFEADPVLETLEDAPLELATPDHAEWDVAMDRQPIDEPEPEPPPEAPPPLQAVAVPVPAAQDPPALEPDSISPTVEPPVQPPLISFVAPLTRQVPPADRFAPVATSALPTAALTRACVSCELPLSARVVFCRRCGSRQPELSHVVG
jgi:hypothetical protein